MMSRLLYILTLGNTSFRARTFVVVNVTISAIEKVYVVVGSRKTLLIKEGQ